MKQISTTILLVFLTLATGSNAGNKNEKGTVMTTETQNNPKQPDTTSLTLAAVVVICFEP